MKIDFFGPPKKSIEELDRLYNDNQFLIMDQVLESNKTYGFIFQDLLDILKYGYEEKRIRSRMVHYKFHKNDKDFKKMELRHLVSNLIFWRSLIGMDKVELLDESFIFDFSKFSTGTLLEYINEKLLPIGDDEDFASKNAMIDDIYHGIISISHAFCMLFGYGVSIYRIKELEEKYPEVHSILYEDIDESLSSKEIEEELVRKTDRLIDIIIHDDGPTPNDHNDFKPLFAPGAGIKKPQFREFILKIGFKADLNGNIIPIMNQGSFLKDGLPKPSLYYINALSGRKSLISVKQGMGIPGAFSKKLSQAATATILSKTEDRCDTVHPIEYKINDDLMLSLLDGRYYYTQDGEMKYLNYKNDKHLIGKIIRFRSPVTCTCKDGICKTCYGKLYNTNKDLFSVGSLSAIKCSEPVQQGQLSVKHNQDTHSNEISFNDEFNTLFEVTAGEVSLRQDSDDSDDFYIILDDVMEDEMDDSTYYYTYSFTLYDATTDTKIEIKEDNGAKLYFGDQIISLYKKLKDPSTPIPLDSLDDESSLFNIEVKNREMTDAIKIFQKILNTDYHGGADNISELCQVFAEALMSLGQKYDLVAAECILRSLVRKRSNILEFPDFTRAGNPDDLQIIKLNHALEHNPSALLSMPYGYLKKQLSSTELYEKTAPSHLDTLYTEELSKYLD